MIIKSIIGAICACLAVVSLNASATLILDFENLYTGVEEYGYMPSDYEGFQFSSTAGYVTKNYTTHPGYVNGTVGNVSLFTAGANGLEITRNETFNFISSAVNLYTNNSYNIATFDGYLDGDLKYSKTIEFIDRSFPLTYYDFNYYGIDQLVVRSQEYVVIDDFKYSVPEPSIAALLILGLFGIGSIRVTRRKKHND